MVGLPDDEKNFEDMCTCLDTIPACNRQTDRRTDGQTSFHGIVRAMHMRCAVKTVTHRQLCSIHDMKILHD